MKTRYSPSSYTAQAGLPVSDQIKPYVPYLLLGTGIVFLAGMLYQDAQRGARKGRRRKKR